MMSGWTKRIAGSLLAVFLGFSALPAMADEVRSAGRDFDHLTTGFPLTGGHATTPCETCHIGGVFKGTPRACDGCHSLGRRVVATPKSTNHVVTDAPCETCHFNTASFLGARFNHGTAKPGECVSCHNNRISAGRPANHTSPTQLGGSCDQCHRTYAWLPAGWNHIGVTPGTCNQAGCHLPGNTNQYTYATATTPINHSSYADTRTKSCDACHISYSTWLSVTHEPVTGPCSGCHNGSNAEGPRADHLGWSGWPTECSQCHTSTTTWLGALGAKPSNHIPYNSGVNCSSCHLTATTVATGATLHAYVSSVCKTCHDSNSPAYLGSMTRKRLGGHEGSTTSQDCTSCHARQYNRWNNP